MKRIQLNQFIAFAILLVGMFSCEKSELETEQNSAVPALSVISSESYYHHDGVSPTARKLTVFRNSDGSVEISRENVGLSDAGELFGYVALDYDSRDAQTNTMTYGPTTPDGFLWYIPFDDDPAIAMAGGGTSRVICHCDGLDGFCMTGIGPTRIGGPVESFFCAAKNCGGCRAHISFSPLSADQPPGITLRASQLTIL